MPRPVTSAMTFGYGRMPTDPKAVAIYKKLGLKGHNGDDYAVYKVPTFSIVRGRVVTAGWVADGGGFSVRIRFRWNDGREYIAQHDHLSRVDVKVGDTVVVGQRVGITGNSGDSTGFHLHFAIRPVNGYNANDGYYGYVNPAPFYEGVQEMFVYARPITPLEGKVKKPIKLINIETGAEMHDSGHEMLLVAKTNIVHGSTFLIPVDRWEKGEPFGFREQDVYAKWNDVKEAASSSKPQDPSLAEKAKKYDELVEAIKTIEILT